MDEINLFWLSYWNVKNVCGWKMALSPISSIIGCPCPLRAAAKRVSLPFTMSTRLPVCNTVPLTPMPVGLPGIIYNSAKLTLPSAPNVLVYWYGFG